MTDGKRLCCNCLWIIKSVLQPILIFVVLDIVSFIPVPSYFNYINVYMHLVLPTLTTSIRVLPVLNERYCLQMT